LSIFYERRVDTADDGGAGSNDERGCFSMTKQEIVERVLHADVNTEIVDYLVYDLKGEEAAAINNGGLEKQMQYILECCSGAADIALILLKEAGCDV